VIPDHSTLWRFREVLGPKLCERIFVEIGRQIETSGFVMKQGTLIDASLVPSAVNAPNGRMSRRRPTHPAVPGASL